MKAQPTKKVSKKTPTRVLKDKLLKAKTTAQPRKCGCGCGELTKGGRFCQGHDATLKSRLYSSIVTDEGAPRTGARATRAIEQLKSFGWPMPKALVAHH